MFLSQGGNSLDEVDVSDQAKVKRDVVTSVRALHGHGVVHTDVRDANVLWDGKRVMLIDFEQAELVEPRRALDPVVPNKRLWRAEGTGETTADKRLKKRGDLKMQKDIREVEGIFD